MNNQEYVHYTQKEIYFTRMFFLLWMGIRPLSYRLKVWDAKIDV